MKEKHLGPGEEQSTIIRIILLNTSAVTSRYYPEGFYDITRVLSFVIKCKQRSEGLSD